MKVFFFSGLVMRLHAEVDVVNRQNLCLFLNVFSIGDNDRQLAAQGMKKSGKRSKSQLAIGRKPLAEGGQEVFSCFVSLLGVIV